MTDDAKEWKTVKIEEPVRDDAQDDPRTYTEIMRAGLNGGTRDVEDAAAEGIDIETFAENLQGHIDLRTAIREELSKHASETANRQPPIDADLREQLDRIESAASTAEERTGSIENTLEELSR